MCMWSRIAARAIVVCLVVLALGVPALAQGRSGPLEESEAEQTGPRGLDVAFSALGRSWASAPELEPRDEAVELDLEDALTPQDAAEAIERSAAAAFVPGTIERRSLYESVRYETRLAGTEIMPGGQVGSAAAGDFKGAASLAQERARRAVIEALSETSLGRSMGRFLFYEQDTLDTDRNPFVPRVKPKIRYRSRELGISFVWRF